MLDAFPGVSTTVLFERLCATCDTGEPSDFEVCYPNESGGAWFRYLLAPVDGSVAASFIDVTANKRLEQELRRRAEALKEADKRKNEFLAVLAHELRNPLAPVSPPACRSLKRLGGDSRTDAHAATLWIGSSRRIVHLIDDLLNISPASKQGKTDAASRRACSSRTR